MAGRDLPGPNSLDRKTKFQRNFNQLWWESEREREGRGRRAGSGGRAGREVGAGWWCREGAALEEPWRGLVAVGTPVCLPHGGRGLSLLSQGCLCAAEPSQPFSCRGDGLSPLDRADPHHARVIFSTTVESVHMVLKRLSKNPAGV